MRSIVTFAGGPSRKQTILLAPAAFFGIHNPNKYELQLSKQAIARALAFGRGRLTLFLFSFVPVAHMTQREAILRGKKSSHTLQQGGSAFSIYLSSSPRRTSCARRAEDSHLADIFTLDPQWQCTVGCTLAASWEAWRN